MRLFTLVVAFVLALGTLSAANQHVRPFEVSIVGNANPVPDPENPCVLPNTESAVIHGTHLGRGTWDSFETVNFCTNPEGADVVGEFTLTAANGDQIFGTYTTLLHADPVAGTIEASGEYEITGGTGRFEDATGSGTIDATGDFGPPFAVVGAMSGGISY